MNYTWVSHRFDPSVIIWYNMLKCGYISGCLRKIHLQTNKLDHTVAVQLVTRKNNELKSWTNCSWHTTYLWCILANSNLSLFSRKTALSCGQEEEDNLWFQTTCHIGLSLAVVIVVWWQDHEGGGITQLDACMPTVSEIGDSNPGCLTTK